MLFHEGCMRGAARERFESERAAAGEEVENIRVGDPIYEEVKRLSYELAHMGIDIVTGGGPGLMEAANAAVPRRMPARLRAGTETGTCRN